LILEALKKLEREKRTPERGFLVTTSVAWPSRGRLSAAYVLGGLALAAAGALGAWLVLGGSRPRPVAVAPAPPVPSTLPAPPATTLAALAPAPVRLPPSPSPRPFAPAVVEPRRARAPAEPENLPTPEPTPDSELRLEAVSRRDGQPVAVLSGRLVHEGDAFDNVRVLRIGETEVELEVDGQRRVLRF
jgi:hypothetical protein